MGLFSRLFGKVKKKVNIAIIGLDNAGKSTTLNFLVEGEPTETIPTMGANYQQIQLKKIQLNMIDLGGQKAFRQFWKGPLQSSQCMIFVIDSTDIERFLEAKEELENAMTLFPKNFPILILANKQDLDAAVPKVEIMRIFELHEKFNGRDWHIENTSALFGTGLSESFHWLYEHITGEKVKKMTVPRDIIIFDASSGLPIISKSEIFKEGQLAAGFLSAMHTFVSTVAQDTITSITMGKNKILFQHMKEIIGAIILSAQENEKIAAKLLEDLLIEIIAKGIDMAEQVLTNFVIDKLKNGKN